ncbi:hypothetical protein ACTOB_003771 [Actinoplanes oblitus]|uniref:Uncharacterized protein n=1 Tax=Actinoplanes oblitus TaxID=3040509 RepID=A0ABY8WQF3_9ACTN|nr:hypothetical protein [Actinoplanes oblitus]WIN00090.1 hypothetical protein ACTOB_003771 [Actinoplanes oblitus]
MIVRRSEVSGTDAAEAALVAFARAHIEFVDAHHRGPQGWRYATKEHLLLDIGRLHTAGPLPDGIDKMPDQFCYSNAAAVARRRGLLYAEGIAAFSVSGTVCCLAHGWCVTTDGIAIDPTWDPGTGLAYLGVAISDESLWPTEENFGVFDDYARVSSLLANGFAPQAVAALGREIPARP